MSAPRVPSRSRRSLDVMRVRSGSRCRPAVKLPRVNCLRDLCGGGPTASARPAPVRGVGPTPRRGHHDRTIGRSDDRTVGRELTVDLRVRDDAPVFVDEDGSRYWLVPLTLRRRTLVAFHIRTEGGEPVRMPGPRLAQQLDEAILMAAAASARPALDRHDPWDRHYRLGPAARRRSGGAGRRGVGPHRTRGPPRRRAAVGLRRTPVFAAAAIAHHWPRVNDRHGHHEIVDQRHFDEVEHVGPLPGDGDGPGGTRPSAPSGASRAGSACRGS